MPQTSGPKMSDGFAEMKDFSSVFMFSTFVN